MLALFGRIDFKYLNTQKKRTQRYYNLECLLLLAQNNSIQLCLTLNAMSTYTEEFKLMIV